MTLLVAGGGSKKRFPICSRLCSRRCEKRRPTTASVVGKMVLECEMAMGGVQQPEQHLFWWKSAAGKGRF